jgi:heme/copper-type cytochrome/quinol oxidase subunit 3
MLDLRRLKRVAVQPDQFSSGDPFGWYPEEDTMKHRVLFIAFMIVALVAMASVPRANADPLTIMAVIGVVTVLTASSVDIIASHSEDNKDQRAQLDEAAKMHAKAEASGVTSGSEAAVVAPD